MGIFTASKETESGTIEAIGFGQVSINLDFNPTSFSYQIEDDPHDPGPLSQNPVKNEQVKISSAKVKNKWVLTFDWHVFGVKHITWQASNE